MTAGEEHAADVIEVDETLEETNPTTSSSTSSDTWLWSVKPIIHSDFMMWK